MKFDHEFLTNLKQYLEVHQLPAPPDVVELLGELEGAIARTSSNHTLTFDTPVGRLRVAFVYDKDYSISEELIRAGLVTRSQWLRAKAQPGASEKLADELMIEHGFCTRDEVEELHRLLGYTDITCYIHQADEGVAMYEQTIVAAGTTKRNPNDPPNKFLGRRIAFERALRSFERDTRRVLFEGFLRNCKQPAIAGSLKDLVDADMEEA